MSIRLALCGAAGTGKTSIVERVSQELGLPINPVGSRPVAKEMGFDNPYDVDRAGMRAEFQKRLYDKKLAWEAAHDDFITDRSHFDNLAYSLLHYGDHLEWNDFQKRVDANERYTTIVYLPRKNFQKLGGDPMRVPNMAYHEGFDVLVSGLLRRYCPLSKLFALVAVGIEFRVADIIRVVARDTGE